MEEFRFLAEQTHHSSGPASLSPRSGPVSAATGISSDANFPNETKAQSSRFIATVSHELRTPLAGVIGAVSLLADTPLTIEQQEIVRIAQICSVQLLSVINDVLELSKLDADKLKLDAVPFYLHEALEDAIQVLYHAADQKNLELVIDVEPFTYQLLGDVHRLRQIAVNLLSNAVKFTFRGEVVLRARTRRADVRAGEEEVLISVSDTGIGIPADIQPLLFQPFTQADSSNTRKFGGSGLGLHICMRLAQMMHGSVWFESTEGSGSTFYCRVFMRIMDGGAPTVLPRVTNAHVVIIESNLTSSAVLAQKLSTWGYHVSACAAVEDAVELLRQQHNSAAADHGKNNSTCMADVLPVTKKACYESAAYRERLILLDVYQYNPAAMEQLSQFHYDVILTGMRRLDTARTYQFLQKPWRNQSLISVLHGEQQPMNTRQQATQMQTQLLTQLQHLQQLQQQQQPPPPLPLPIPNATLSLSTRSPPPSDECPSRSPSAGTTRPASAIRVLLAEDNIMNQKIIRKLLDSLGFTNCMVVNNGREALEAVQRDSPFDVILMDLMMPEMGGIEAMEHIRRLPGSSAQQPRVFALTASALAEDHACAHRAGMNGVIMKPVTRDELRAVLMPFVLPTPNAELLLSGASATDFVHSRQEMTRSLLADYRELEQLPHPSLLLDANGIIHYANPATSRYFGYSIGELVGKNARLLLPSDGTTVARENYLGKFFATRDSNVIGFGKRVEALRKDGFALHLLLSLTENQRATNTFVMKLEDLAMPSSSDSDSDAKIRLTRRSFDILETLLDPVIVINETGMICFANRPAIELLGWSASELIGRNVNMLMPSPYREQHDSFLRNYLTTGKAKVIGRGRPVPVLKKNGEQLMAQLTVTEHVRGRMERLFIGVLRALNEG